MPAIIQYVRANSHAILATVVALQNMHVFKGVFGSFLSAVVDIASAFSAQ